MFDFLDSDWFIISIEVIFLLLILYDAKKYFETKRKEYLTNIALTFGFFIWAALPFYNSYITWTDVNKDELKIECIKENNVTVCECVNNSIYKEYAYNTYLELSKSKDDDFIEFINEIKKECIEDD